MMMFTSCGVRVVWGFDGSKRTQRMERNAVAVWRAERHARSQAKRRRCGALLPLCASTCTM